MKAAALLFLIVSSLLGDAWSLKITVSSTVFVSSEDAPEMLIKQLIQMMKKTLPKVLLLALRTVKQSVLSIS